jgi:FdhD protein
MTDGSTSRHAIRVRDGVAEVTDDLTVEEPMEIRVDGTAVAVVMRTPGHDADLVRGFALTEGIVASPTAIAEVAALGDGRWDLRTADGIDVDASRFQRNFYATSSCGVCGKASIDAIRVTGGRPPAGPVISQDVVRSLPACLAEEQTLFSATGGLHAAGLFDGHGDLLMVREDVGRHNAVDKVIGHASSRQWPLPPLGLVVSGRISFEITQKAAVAGIGLVCGVSAASSLAVDLAEEFGMTVVGFVREPGFTVYSGPERIEGLVDGGPLG